MLNNLFTLLCFLLLIALFFGISFLYTGTIRRPYALAPLVQGWVILSCSFVVWLIVGEQLVLGESYRGLIGIPGLGSIYHANTLSPQIFSLFQAFFCAIATYILIGSAMERLRLKSALLIALFWPLLVYLPIAHWIWNPQGVFARIGAIDFAGGIVVHVSSGVSALVLAIMCGRRRDYFNFRPRLDQRMIFLGMVMVFVGWLGFNGGSAYEWSGVAMQAIQVTWIAGICAIFSGGLVEYLHTPHRMSLSHLALSLISALVIITPAAGVINSSGAMLVGLLSGPFVFYSVRIFHHIFKVDDALDVFISHGLSGIIGAIVTGFISGGVAIWANLISTVVVIIYSILMTWLLLRTIAILLRTDLKAELETLDITDHGEKVFE